MTPEQQDASNWLARGPELSERISAAMHAIFGRDVPFAVLVWPHGNKTYIGTNADREAIKQGMQHLLDSFDTLRTEAKP